MALSPFAMRAVDSVMDKLLKRIWNLPVSFPSAGLHFLQKDFGLDIHTVCENLCGADIRHTLLDINSKR